MVTAFTYGDPARVSPLLGVSFSGPAFPPSTNQYPVPLDAELPHATIGTAYSTTLTAVWGTAPYTFTVTVGALPSGLSLASGGAITGTPSGSPGTSTFTVTVTDAHSLTGSESFNIVVANAAVTASNYAYFGGT